MATHILLIEPDAVHAVDFDERIKAFMDARVEYVPSDLDAITLVQAGVQPDVAIIVWGNQELRGTSLVRSLREYLPSLPIVLVFEEGASPPEVVGELDVQGVLSKPYSFNELPAMLRHAIQQAPPHTGVDAEQGREETSIDIDALFGEQESQHTTGLLPEDTLPTSIDVSELFTGELDPGQTEQSSGTEVFDGDEGQPSTGAFTDELEGPSTGPFTDEVEETTTGSFADEVEEATAGPFTDELGPTETSQFEDEAALSSTSPFVDEGEGRPSRTETFTDELPAEGQSLATMLDETLPGPGLGDHLELSQDQKEQLVGALTKFGERLETMPTLLSQDGALISHEIASEDGALALARLAGRVWREGATRLAREFLCFSDQVSGEQRSLALYSIIVAGDLTLSVGWDGSTSLSTLRSSAHEVVGVMGSVLI